MNCHYHPERPVARECRVCHELICSECVVPVGEHAVCKSCVTETLVINENGLRDAKAPVSTATTQQLGKDQKAVNVLKNKSESLRADHKSAFLTVLFSCLPGLGHYYLGMQKRALNLMILFFMIIFLNVIVPGALQFPVGVAIPILWFYSQFDALKYRTLINYGETVEDVPLFPQLSKFFRGASFGWILAGVSVIALLYSVVDLFGYDWRLREAVKEIITAGLLFGIGYWILKGKPLPFGADQEESEDHNHA